MIPMKTQMTKHLCKCLPLLMASIKFWEALPVLVEVKRFISRSAPAGALKDSLRDKLEIAKADVLKQASLLLLLERCWLIRDLN